VHEHFCIAFCAENVTLSEQLITQFLEVIDFAITNDPNGFILIGYRLVSASQVYNAQSAHPQSDAAAAIRAFVVGAAMRDTTAHPRKQGGPRGIIGLEVEDPVYPAHLSSPLPLAK
jgi:hypothetical protein